VLVFRKKNPENPERKKFKSSGFVILDKCLINVHIQKLKLKNQNFGCKSVIPQFIHRVSSTVREWWVAIREGVGSFLAWITFLLSTYETWKVLVSLAIFFF
jgi:hypothetical protein